VDHAEYTKCARVDLLFSSKYVVSIMYYTIFKLILFTLKLQPEFGVSSFPPYISCKSCSIVFLLISVHYDRLYVKLPINSARNRVYFTAKLALMEPKSFLSARSKMFLNGAFNCEVKGIVEYNFTKIIYSA
jgi:hypothetical protein